MLTSFIASKSGINIWIPVIVAVVSGLFTLVGYFLKWYLDARKARKKNAMARYIELYHDMNQLMNDELQRIGAQQIVVFKVENGGGVPKPGAQIYSSVVWEAFDPPMKSIQKDWQRQPVGPQLTDILTEVIGRGETRFALNDLRESTVRTFYEAQNIAKVEMKHLHANESRIIVLAVAYMYPETELMASFRAARTAVLSNNLSNVIAKMEKVEQEGS